MIIIFSLYNAARDLNLRIEEIKMKHPKLKCIMVGASMGGLIASLMVKVGIPSDRFSLRTLDLLKAHSVKRIL